MRTITLGLALVFTLASAALATDQLDPKPARVLTGAAAQPWERVELLRDRHPELVTEKFLRNTEVKDLVGEGIVDAFGTSRPSSGTVLLHYAPGWNSAKGVPV